MPRRHTGRVKTELHSFSNLAHTRWEWSASTLWSTCPRGKSSHYAINRKLEGPHSRSVWCGVKEISCFMLGIKPRFLSCLYHSPVTITMEPSLLQIQTIHEKASIPCSNCFGTKNLTSRSAVVIWPGTNSYTWQNHGAAIMRPTIQEALTYRTRNSWAWTKDLRT